MATYSERHWMTYKIHKKKEKQKPQKQGVWTKTIRTAKSTKNNAIGLIKKNHIHSNPNPGNIYACSHHLSHKI